MRGAVGSAETIAGTPPLKSEPDCAFFSPFSENPTRVPQFTRVKADSSL